MMDKRLKKQSVLLGVATVSALCFGALSVQAQDLPSGDSLLRELKTPVKSTSSEAAKTPNTSTKKQAPPRSTVPQGLPPTKLAVPEVPASEPAPKTESKSTSTEPVTTPNPLKDQDEKQPTSQIAPSTEPSATPSIKSAPTPRKATTPAPTVVAPRNTTPRLTATVQKPTITPSKPVLTPTAPSVSATPPGASTGPTVAPSTTASEPAVVKSPQTGVPLQMVQSMFESLHEAERSRYVDLTPWLDSELWWKAHEAMRDNKCSKGLTFARKAVNARYPLSVDRKSRPREVRYALARFELCGGQAATGRKTMRDLAMGKDGVALLARRALGMSANIDYAPQKKSSKTSARQNASTVSVRQFESLCKQGRKTVEEMTQLFDALRDTGLSRSRWQRTTVAMANYLERKRKIEDAGRLWLGLYERTRSRRTGAAFARQLSRFERRHKVKLRTLDVRMDDVRHLIVEKNYKKARKLIVQNANMARVKPQELRGWRMYVKAMELERRRKRDDAVALFAKADKLIKHPVARARLYSGWARALRRVNKDLKAVALYQKLCNEHPNEHKLCAEALYQSGRLLQYENKLKEAYDAFFLLAGFYPESKRMPEVIWRAALCAYLLKRYDAMKPLLATIQTRWPNKRDSSGLPIGLKAQYWMGVVAMKQKRQEDALNQFQRTIAMGPLTWYGRLAHARLKQMGASVPDALPMSQLTLQDLNTLEAMRVPRDKRMTMAAPLIRTGFYPDAYNEVRRYSYTSSPLPEGKAILAALKLALGRPDLAHWMARKLIRVSGPTVNTLRTWATSFPLVHIEHIHKYAQEYKVNPMLVQAIMRQESGFRAKVKSYAGALGLMQLMPGTAKYVARVFLDDTAYRRKHIFVPETNIKLGSMYIRLHVAFAADEVPLALAGYNAGPAPLKRWVKDYGDREMDAWVESITYQQARGYVRKVMTSYIAYSALYHPEKMPTISLKVPKSLRKWGKIPGVGVQTVSQVDFKGVSGDALANSMLDGPHEQ